MRDLEEDGRRGPRPRLRRKPLRVERSEFLVDCWSRILIASLG